MILQAQKDLSIDLSHFVLIGDKVSNIQAWNATEVGTNLLLPVEDLSEPGDLNYELIATMCKAKAYLQRGVQ